MSNSISVPFLLLVAIIQTTFVPYVRFLGGGPDLVLLVVLTWSINATIEESLIWAFIGGISIDLLSAAPTGTTVLGLVMIVFFVAGLGSSIYRIGILLLGALVIGGTITSQIAQFIVLELAGFQVDWLDLTDYVVLPTIIYNVLFIAPVYWLVTRFQRRIARTGRALTSQSKV